MTLWFDLAINQGETTSIIFPVIDQNGQPVNVTGWTARAQIRETELTPVLYEWSAANSNITVSGTSVTLSVPAATSAVWMWTAGRYDLELTDTRGSVYRIAEGKVHVSPQMTH